MTRLSRALRLLRLALSALLALGISAAGSLAAEPQSADGARIFEEARPRLFQIRTLTRSGGTQASIGSGFLVAPNLAVTNFHVVSQWITEDAQHQLEWVGTDNKRGALTVMAVDIAHDLAVVRLDGEFKEISPYTLSEQEPRRGEKAFSLGRPLDLGFNIVEGIHNGLVEGDYNEQYHFSGAINAGMSGGPAVNAGGRVFGINVAHNLRGELVSYLVPARFAIALLAKTPSEPPGAAGVRKDMIRQLRERQSALMKRLFEKPLPVRKLGGFTVSAEMPPLIKCWSSSKAQSGTRDFGEDQQGCYVNAALYLGNELTAGSLQITHQYLHSRNMSRLRFASMLSQQYEAKSDSLSDRHAGAERCRDDFVSLSGRSWRVLACMRTLRKYPGMYQLRLTAVSMDGRSAAEGPGVEAVISRLLVDIASLDDIDLASRRFLESLH